MSERLRDLLNPDVVNGANRLCLTMVVAVDSMDEYPEKLKPGKVSASVC